MDLSQRIEIAELSKGHTNCLGTALFLAGAHLSDAYLYAHEAEELIYENPLDKPEMHCLLVIYYKGGIEYMAFVTNTDPLLFMQRVAEDGLFQYGPFQKNVTLEKIIKDYHIPGCRIEYRKPKLFE